MGAIVHGAARKADGAVVSSRAMRPAHWMAPLGVCTTFVASLVAIASAQSTDKSAPSRERFRLEYVITPDATGCPSSDELKSLVTARLGYDPFDATAASSVDARVVTAAGRLKAEVVLRNADGGVRGRRQTSGHGSECRAVIESLALAVAIGIDPLAFQTPVRASASASAPAPELTPTRPVIAPPQPATFATAAMQTTVSPTPPSAKPVLGASGLLGWGILPGTAFGVAVSAGVRWVGTSLHGEARYLFPKRVEGSGEASADAHLVGLSVLPCGRFGNFAACGVLAAGALRAGGVGLDHPKRESAFWAAAGARGGATMPFFGAFSAQAGIEVLANLNQVSLRANNTELWQAAPAQAQTWVGIEAVVP